MARSRIELNVRELAGSFGDIGTDLPLLIAMIAAAGLDAGAVFIAFGLAQISVGLYYGLPMPMQPLKAMAVIVITQQIAPNVLYGAGLAIGVVMLVLAASGGLAWLCRVVPRPVVRGVQLGLALSLAQLALRDYVPALGAPGFVLAGLSVIILGALWGNRRVPAALPVIALGAAYAVAAGFDVVATIERAGVSIPTLHVPTWSDIATGFVVLALPQLPLSLSNSIIATDRTLEDLFPERPVGVRQLGFTYGLANLVLPFLGGVPACHGCGGLAGHHAFGGRTGGSVVIYGGMFLLVGLAFGAAATDLVALFPYPVLGVILLFEAAALATLTRDVASERRDLTVTILVAACAMALPHGYIVGLLAGTLLYRVVIPDRGAPGET